MLKGLKKTDFYLIRKWSPNYLGEAISRPLTRARIYEKTGG